MTSLQLTRKFFLILICWFSSATLFGQVYRISTFRAAPGAQLEFQELLRDKADTYPSVKPLVIRHSQGDQWDYMVIEYISDLAGFLNSVQGEIYNPPFASTFYNLVAHHEHTMMNGPSVSSFTAMHEAFDYYHVEMFVALPGKQEELHQQRKMENVYLQEIGRNPNLIFLGAGGGPWDCMTLGGYRDIKHFAESADIPLEVEETAAVKAGFKGVRDISPYLRSLIQRHNDTLGGKVY